MSNFSKVLILTNVITIFLCKSYIKSKNDFNKKRFNIELNSHIYTQAELRSCDYMLELFYNCENDDSCNDVESDIKKYLQTKGRIK